MRAWRFYGIDDMRLDEVPDPQVRPGWVVVKMRVIQPSVTEVIRAKGLATLGSDYVRKAIAERAPVQLLGHEFCGEVIQVGEGVEELRRGDRVAARSRIPCHKCEVCRSGYEDYCRKGPVVGRQIPGCFAEYAVLPAEALIRIPSRVSDNEGACIQPLTSCVASVGTAQLKMGDTVVVLGQGVMGLSLLQVARTAGAGRVITVDVRDRALALSRQLGADLVIDARSHDPVESILDATRGRGADVVFEMAGGNPQQGLSGASTLRQAIQVVRDAGKIVMVAMVGEPVDLDLNVFREKALRMLFPDSPSTAIMEHSVHLVATGQVKVGPTITHILSGLERLPEAFEITANKAKYDAVNPAQVVL